MEAHSQRSTTTATARPTASSSTSACRQSWHPTVRFSYHEPQFSSPTWTVASISTPMAAAPMKARLLRRRPGTCIRQLQPSLAAPPCRSTNFHAAWGQVLRRSPSIGVCYSVAARLPISNESPMPHSHSPGRRPSRPRSKMPLRTATCLVSRTSRVGLETQPTAAPSARRRPRNRASAARTTSSASNLIGGVAHSLSQTRQGVTSQARVAMVRRPI